MAGSVKPVPEGYHLVTPYLCIKGASEAIEFYKSAFDATELMRIPSPYGSIGHAEIQIGDSRIMISDESPEMGFRSPATIGGTPVHVYMYVEDVDRIFAQAIAAGATAMMPFGRPILGRPHRHFGRPIRAPLVREHPQGRPDRRRGWRTSSQAVWRVIGRGLYKLPRGRPP